MLSIKIKYFIVNIWQHFFTGQLCAAVSQRGIGLAIQIIELPSTTVATKVNDFVWLGGSIKAPLTSVLVALLECVSPW